MMAPEIHATVCDDHAAIARGIAALEVQRGHLAEQRSELIAAVAALEVRVRGLERSVAVWGGVLSALAALPWLVRLVQAIGPGGG